MLVLIPVLYVAAYGAADWVRKTVRRRLAERRPRPEAAPRPS